VGHGVREVSKGSSVFHWRLASWSMLSYPKLEEAGTCYRPSLDSVINCRSARLREAGCRGSLQWFSCYGSPLTVRVPTRFITNSV